MPSFFKKNQTLYDDPQNGQRWNAEDLANVTENFHKQNAKNVEAAKDAKDRGVKLGLKSEAGRMIPPPPGWDLLADRVCSGPGLVKQGFGQPKVCGRQATAFLQVAHFEPDVPKSPSGELTTEVLAYVAYGASAGPNPVPAATGPRKGKMIADPGVVGPNSKFVCPFHSQALYRNSLHPEDNNGIVPVAPKLTGELVVSPIEDVESFGMHRVVATDPNFTYLASKTGRMTVRTWEYCRYLDSLGLLPEDGRLM